MEYFFFIDIKIRVFSGFKSKYSIFFFDLGFDFNILLKNSNSFVESIFLFLKILKFSSVKIANTPLLMDFVSFYR